MGNITKLLEKHTEKLEEQRHILLAFFSLMGHFNFFQDKANICPEKCFLF